MSPNIKVVAIACGLIGAVGPASADSQFWVAGNRATPSCEIVTSNPVLDPVTGFASGPYRSLDDAKLARSGIPLCPKVDETQSSSK